MSIDSIVTDFVVDTPPGELSAVVSDIKTIIDDQSKNFSSAYDQLIALDFQLVRLGSGNSIISTYNKTGTKYLDYLLGKKFDVDMENLNAIDIETFEPQLDLEFDKISGLLQDYCQDHFPSNFACSLVPIDDDEVAIIIINEKLNAKNFYNGKWTSSYVYNKSSKSLKGDIKINVHYYEDGNVRLTTSKSVSESSISVDELVNKISQFEDELETSLLINVSKLNEEYFKNLRRQLPINRSKVQWGKSIKNYKLGKDVAGVKE